MFNIATGLMIIFGSYRFAAYLQREIGGADMRTAANTALKWLVIAVKIIILGGIWLTVIPLLLGLTFEAIAVVPLRTSANETPRYPVVQCWALGLVFLKIWTRCLLLGALGENVWRARLERVVVQGFMHVDALFVTNEIIFPALLFLCDYLLIPYFLGRLAGLVIENSYESKTFLVRFSFLTFVFLRILLSILASSYKAFQKLHNDIRDSRYLVGTELTNR